MHTMGPLITNVVILDALPASELQTGTGLLNHLQDHLEPSDFKLVAYDKIRTEADVESLLLHIRSKAREGCKPIIHIECHGDPEKGIKLERGYFKWQRLLEHLRRINTIAKNNVVLFLSGCHGGNVILDIDITKPCPFLLLVATDNEVSAGFIQDNVGQFYVRLIQTEDFKLSAKCLEPVFQCRHAELLFIDAFPHIRSHAARRKLGNKGWMIY